MLAFGAWALGLTQYMPPVCASAHPAVTTALIPVTEMRPLRAVFGAPLPIEKPLRIPGSHIPPPMVLTSCCVLADLRQLCPPLSLLRQIQAGLGSHPRGRMRAQSQGHTEPSFGPRLSRGSMQCITGHRGTWRGHWCCRFSHTLEQSLLS